MFYEQIKSSGPRNALFIQRGGKDLTWTWDGYYAEAMKFAKACTKLQVKERSSIAIMGFNSPEWVFAFVGGVLNNCIGTGIYSTNAPEACLYQVDHSEAEIVCVETNDMLKRFNLDKLPRVRAYVVWGEAELPKDVKSEKFYLWKDFMKLGNDIADKVIIEKSQRQKPGECASMIYTSGTTGMPKGCMLSHDNICCAGIPMVTEV